MVLYNEMCMFFLTCLGDRDITLAFAKGLDAGGSTKALGNLYIYPGRPELYIHETTVLEMPGPTSQLVAKS